MDNISIVIDYNLYKRYNKYIEVKELYQYFRKKGNIIGMCDKQYDDFLLDNIEDWEDIIELLEAKEYDKALAVAKKKRTKNQNKLESPNGNN